MSTYTGSTPPSVSLDPRIVPFFERFYTVSDSPTAHTEYADSFVPDADFVMGIKTTSGYDGILELRKGLWTGPIVRRKHHLYKIFPFGPDSLEVMVYGKVEYGLKNGKEIEVQWAGRAVLEDYQGGLRFRHYQVYLVSLGAFPCPILSQTEKTVANTRLSVLLQSGFRSRCECLERLEDESTLQGRKLKHKSLKVSIFSSFFVFIYSSYLLTHISYP